MKVAISSDHAGVELKAFLLEVLPGTVGPKLEGGLELVDLGPNDKTSVDYPDYASRLGRAVVAGEFDKGILICGSGIGMSISANKVDGIRAALCTNEYMARMSRAHNDANVIVLAERVLGPALAQAIAEAWFDADFEGGRHARRVAKIAALEEG